MDRQFLRELRLDRRLIRRRNWIAREDLERELAELPDIADKVAPEEPSEQVHQESEPE